MTERQETGAQDRPAAEGATAIWSVEKPTEAPATAEPLEPQDPEPENEAGPRLLLLGTDDAGEELTVALQRLGAEVMTADAETLTDAEELTAVLVSLQPDFVVTRTDAVVFGALEAFESAEGQDVEGTEFACGPAHRRPRGPAPPRRR